MKTTRILLLLSVILLGHQMASAQIISTIAGNHSRGATGDGGPATAATFDQPNDLAIDGMGNIYIADVNNNAIRKINAAGIISTYAGTIGTMGYTGDGGAATAATLSAPSGICLDGSGNLYIADEGNNAVRMVSSTGIITTFAGGGGPGAGGDGGPAYMAQLHGPMDVAADAAGNVFIADKQNYKVRKIDGAGNISTFAGTGVSGFSGDGGAAVLAQLSGVTGVSVDGAGNVYVAEPSNGRVRKVDASGTIATFAGTGVTGSSGNGGPATAATFNSVNSIYADGVGNVYIADYANSSIRVVNSAGIIDRFAGIGSRGYSGDGGPATACQLYFPNCAAMAPGVSDKVYIADNLNFVVRMVYINYAPAFSGGASQAFTVCMNDTATSINSLLSISDANVGQTERWTVVTPPAHGVLAGFSATATSTGSTFTPAGLTYQPATGYSGTDVFSIQVSDGLDSTTTTINVTVNPCPLGIASAAPVLTGLKVYPNPSQGALTIEVPQTGSMSAMTLTDMLGRTVATETTEDTKFIKATMSLSNIPAGNYVVKVTSGEMVYREKVVVW